MPLLPTFLLCSIFFFNDTTNTAIYTLSLHDALPICSLSGDGKTAAFQKIHTRQQSHIGVPLNLDASNIGARVQGNAKDRKSTRLNSSHLGISYAVFCLKKKKHTTTQSVPQVQ